MPRSQTPTLLLLLLACVNAQFGILDVDWNGPKPRVAQDKTIKHTPNADIRRSSLISLPTEKLTEIAATLNAQCTTCTKQEHWVSRIRGFCLEASPKALKHALAKRGVKCDGCTMREHYQDRLIDSVHLPVR